MGSAERAAARPKTAVTNVRVFERVGVLTHVPLDKALDETAAALVEVAPL
jgi:hypothetical protein